MRERVREWERGGERKRETAERKEIVIHEFFSGSSLSITNPKARWQVKRFIDKVIGSQKNMCQYL